ncbi:hypothetical protein CKAH01_03576 [Colletotrichum kahawae]|uniref:Uncharacterized protein n=1 Tax=Colletotrichum kahawae TaxID=34407 RepID=A0AAD9YTM7_COLKA|nr:hypothetical protein CKAH01_03576 [Colletotrichum kahawae]
MSSQSHLCSSSRLLSASWAWKSGSRHGSAIPSDWAPRRRADCMSQARGAARKLFLEEQSPHRVPQNENASIHSGFARFVTAKGVCGRELGPQAVPKSTSRMGGCDDSRCSSSPTHQIGGRLLSSDQKALWDRNAQRAGAETKT